MPPLKTVVESAFLELAGPQVLPRVLAGQLLRGGGRIVREHAGDGAAEQHAAGYPDRGLHGSGQKAATPSMVPMGIGCHARIPAVRARRLGWQRSTTATAEQSAQKTAGRPVRQLTFELFDARVGR